LNVGATWLPPVTGLYVVVVLVVEVEVVTNVESAVVVEVVEYETVD